VALALDREAGGRALSAAWLALHVLEVLEALTVSSASGRYVDLTTTCLRPEPVPIGRDESVFT
jgi:hypothetical protein